MARKRGPGNSNNGHLVASPHISAIKRSVNLAVCSNNGWLNGVKRQSGSESGLKIAVACTRAARNSYQRGGAAWYGSVAHQRHGGAASSRKPCWRILFACNRQWRHQAAKLNVLASCGGISGGMAAAGGGINGGIVAAAIMASRWQRRQRQ